MNTTVKSAMLDIGIVLVGCAVLLTTALGAVWRRAATVPAAAHIVIDAGHGGEDGGAVAPDGTLEKHLNLSVSLCLRDVLQMLGYRVSMTRDTDTMLNATGNTLRERKVSDTKNRLALMETAQVTVSIHQNKFSQSKYHGTQVFYAPQNPRSQPLAAAVQSAVVALLQPDNTREIKRGDSSVYLLSHASVPLVLVECGFLSNDEELQKLKDPAYQQQLAFAVACGVLKGT